MVETLTTTSPALRRMTIKEPTWTQATSAQEIQQALLLRIQSKYQQAQEKLEAILAAETVEVEKEELSFRSVWLQCQVIKIMFQRGHFQEVQAKIVELMTKLDDQYSLIAGTILTPRDGPLPDREEIEYLYFKLMYIKAKTARKTRQLKVADDTC